MTESQWWVERMDELKARLGLTDVGLGRALEITGVMVGHIRGGRSALPAAAKVRLLDQLGYALTRDVILLLLPKPVRDLVRASDAQQVRNAKEGQMAKSIVLPKW